MLELVESFLHISWHGDVQYACLLVTVQCDATVETPSPILCDLIIFLECIYEVHCILISLVFDTKFIDHEGKSDFILVVAPQSRSDWSRLISKWSEMSIGHRVCYYS